MRFIRRRPQEPISPVSSDDEMETVIVVEDAGFRRIRPLMYACLALSVILVCTCFGLFIAYIAQYDITVTTSRAELPTPIPSVSPISVAPTTKSPTFGPTTPNPTLPPTTPAPTTQTPTAPPTTPNPTFPPTAPPTLAPTTHSPTVSPTRPPTLAPTTVSPTTASPTLSPTKAPTVSPTTRSPTLPPTTSTPTDSPTVSPTTKSPTLPPTTPMPTNAPTVSPTTSSPTQAPTAAPGLYFFSSPTPANGAGVGNRATFDAYCDALAVTLAPTLLGLPGACLSPGMNKGFVSYDASDQISGWPTYYSFTASTTKAWSAHVAGLQIGTSWTVMMSGVANSLLVTLNTAGLPGASWSNPNRPWTGSDSNGNVNANTCTQWTSSSNVIAGRAGSTIQTSAGWITGANYFCNLLLGKICVCLYL